MTLEHDIELQLSQGSHLVKSSAQPNAKTLMFLRSYVLETTESCDMMGRVRSGEASRDDLVEYLMSSLGDHSSSFAETCNYFYDEATQLNVGMYLVSPQTGKVIRAIEPGDIETPDVLRGGEGSEETHMVKGMPRLKPELESRMILAAHIVEKDSKLRADLVTKFGVNGELPSLDLMMMTHLGRADVARRVTAEDIVSSWRRHNPEVLPFTSEAIEGLTTVVDVRVEADMVENMNPKYPYLGSAFLKAKTLVYSQLARTLGGMDLPKVTCSEALLSDLDVSGKLFLGDPDLGARLQKIPSVLVSGTCSYLVAEGTSVGIKILSQQWSQDHCTYSLTIRAEVTVPTEKFIRLECLGLAASAQVI